MPKASFDPADMYSPSGRGFVETVGTKKPGEITGAIFRYTQFSANKKTGEQLAPLTVFVISIAGIDAAGNRIAEPVDTEMVVEFGPQDASMIKIRPGLGDAASDDPADTLDSNGNLVLGTEGNMLYTEQGVLLNMKLPFGVFTLSCKDHGFKPDVLKNGFAPDFVGTRAVFTLVPDRDGKKKRDGTDITNFVVDSFSRYPYEAAAKAAAKAKAKPAAAPAQASAVTPAIASTSAPAGDIEEICLSALKKVSANHAASPNASDALSRQKVIVLALQQVLAPSSGVAKSKHQAVQACLKNKEWFESNAISFGGVNSGEDQWSLVGAI